MTVTINDGALARMLMETRDVADLVGPSGELLGSFTPPPAGTLPGGVASPYTDAELEAWRAEPGEGRTLEDILRDLVAKDAQ